MTDMDVDEQPQGQPPVLDMDQEGNSTTEQGADQDLMDAHALPTSIVTKVAKNVIPDGVGIRLIYSFK
jgi:hypothetical protein